MMAGNPNWWSMMNGMHPQPNSQFVYGSYNAPLPSNPSPPDHQDFPVRSWSELLLGGLGSGGEEEERYGASLFQQQKKLGINWEDQELNLNPPTSFTRINNNPVINDVKQEVSQSTSSQLYGHQLDQQFQDEFHPNNIIRSSNCWTHHSNQVIPVSSPTSSITTLSNNNFLNFSCAKAAPTVEVNKSNHERHEDHISEGNSRSTGGVSKKARVQQSSAQPALKVRKEKLGDRITALHQLVSPFGKTDTASVLSEAIGYIRFLHAQIEALSSPYMRNASGSTGRGSHQHSDSQGQEARDLNSRGLCLVPISCTQHVGNETGADYWASANLDGGGF